MSQPHCTCQSRGTCGNCTPLPNRLRIPKGATDEMVLRVLRRMGTAHSTEIREALPRTVGTSALSRALRRLEADGLVVNVRYCVWQAKGAA